MLLGKSGIKVAPARGPVEATDKITGLHFCTARETFLRERFSILGDQRPARRLRSAGPLVLDWSSRTQGINHVCLQRVRDPLGGQRIFGAAIPITRSGRPADARGAR